MPDAAVRTISLSKRFGDIIALDDVSMEIHRGEVFGILGPNGAGKTTLLRTILNILRPDSGSVEIFGRPFQRSDRNRIGYLPEERGLYPQQPIGAVLEYFAALKGVGAARARASASYWLEQFGLAEAGRRPVGELSKGNQQKVQLAAAFIAEPEILIVDEPLSGLDPLSAQPVTAAIRGWAAAGRAVLLSTHHMGMAETLCSRLVMIARGRRVLYGDVAAIKRQYAANTVRVRATVDCSRCPLVQQVEQAPDAVNVHLRSGASSDDLLRWLVAAGASVERFERLATPFEEIFIDVARQAEVA